MEDSVKDLDSDINPSTPEPRFSIGSKSPDKKDQIILFNKPIMLKNKIFGHNKWGINVEIHHPISGDWKQTYKSMNDEDDWVICSNRQDAELDADIRSV